MLKRTFKYEDLDGNQVEETLYFNLTKAEITEMELSMTGGLGEHINAIVKSLDGAQIIETFKMILLKAVGRRSEDGRRLYKSEEIQKDFLFSPAYDEMFMSLVTDADAAAEFIKAIVPADISEEFEKTEVGAAKDGPQTPKPWIEEDREPTQKELVEMSKEDLQEVFRRRQRG